MSDKGIAQPELDEATAFHQQFSAIAAIRNEAVLAAAARNRDLIATKQEPQAPRKGSRIPCLTCHRHKITCDSARPECNKCIKSGRTCEGYARPLTFRDLSDAEIAQEARKVAKIESPKAPIRPPLSSDDSGFYSNEIWEWDHLTKGTRPVPQNRPNWAQAKTVVRSKIHLANPPSPTGSRKYRSSSESEASFVHGHKVRWRGAEELDETTQKFIEDLAERLVQRYSLAARAFTKRPNDPSLTKSASSASGSGSGSTLKAKQASSVPNSRKRSSRSLDDGDDPDDNDDDDRRATDPKRQREKKEQPTKLFACPYAKFDPGRYSEQNAEERSYRGCASKYLRNIPRVKQHLYRVHARPHWYCGNCYEDFKTRERLNSHHRMRPPCEAAPPKYEEMMTDDQYNQTKRRVAGGLPHHMWYGIFNILFPEAVRPLSPYVSTSNPDTLLHFVNFFRAHGPLMMMRLLHESDGSPITLNASTQTVVDEAFEIAISESRWETTPAPEPSLAVLAETTDRSAEAAAGIENAAVVSPLTPLLLSPSLGDPWEVVANPEVTSEAFTMPLAPSSSGPDPDLVSQRLENQQAIDNDILAAFDLYQMSGNTEAQDFWAV